ncbi:hypothetical protein GT354_30515 [Streptomyces sp. SID3343]|nr:hypothetical protein [Streptomyces sp. SID3343]
MIGSITLALATAGCGSDSGGFGDDPFGGKDSAKTNARNAAAMVLTAVDKVHKTDSVKVRLEQSLPSGMKTKAEGVVKFGEPAGMRLNMDMSQTVAGAPANVEMLMTSTAMYMNMGPAVAAETGGKSWLKLDFTGLASLDKSGNGAALGETLSKSMSQQDPTAQLSLLKQSGDITEVGTETVNGVSAVHYSATVDLSAAASASADTLGLSPETLARLKEANAAIGATTSNFDVWIDPKSDMPVKQKVAMKTTAGDMASTVDYSGWGTKVDLTPPPADETADMLELLSQTDGA